MREQRTDLKSFDITQLQTLRKLRSNMYCGGNNRLFFDELEDIIKRTDYNPNTAWERLENNSIVLGEVWEDASNKIAYSKRRKYFWGKELDSVMNYPLKDAIIQFIMSNNTTMFRQTVAMLRDNYPKSVLDSLMNILGTHDTARILTAMGGIHAFTKEEMSRTWMDAETRAVAKERVKAATVLLFTVFGVPCIYYGDEI